MDTDQSSQSRRDKKKFNVGEQVSVLLAFIEKEVLMAQWENRSLSFRFSEPDEKQVERIRCCARNRSMNSRNSRVHRAVIDNRE